MLYDYGRYNVIYDRIKHIISKEMVLQIVLILILQESELIYIVI